VKPWLRILAIVAGIGCIATATKAFLNHLFDDFKGRGEQESETLAEARERGILVSVVVADPGEVEYQGGRIRFGQAWVEERSLRTHRFIWFPTERRRGGYRLQFTAKLTGGTESEWPMLVPDDAGYGVSLVPGDTRVYDVPIESPDVLGLRLSVVRSWKDIRSKNIRFVPQQ
jgi:hypothetical protein